MVKLGRVFACDQCSEFYPDAQGVQVHNEREHDCRWMTRQVRRKDGTTYMVVDTIKCHPRRTLQEIADEWLMDVSTLRMLKRKGRSRKGVSIRYVDGQKRVSVK
jgi:hypothetical protein